MYHGKCTTGFIARGAGEEANTAQGVAECLKTPPQVQIYPAVHKICSILTGLLCGIIGDLNLYLHSAVSLSSS